MDLKSELTRFRLIVIGAVFFAGALAGGAALGGGTVRYKVITHEVKVPAPVATVTASPAPYKIPGSCQRLIDEIQRSLDDFQTVDTATGQELDLMEAAERDIVIKDWEHVREDIIQQRSLLETMGQAQVSIQRTRQKIDQLYPRCQNGES